jgi:hypothetical protein
MKASVPRKRGSRTYETKPFTKQIALRISVGRLKDCYYSLSSKASPDAPGGIVGIIIGIICKVEADHPCLKIKVL